MTPCLSLTPPGIPGHPKPHQKGKRMSEGGTLKNTMANVHCLFILQPRLSPLETRQTDSQPQ